LRLLVLGQFGKEPVPLDARLGVAAQGCHFEPGVGSRRIGRTTDSIAQHTAKIKGCAYIAAPGRLNEQVAAFVEVGRPKVAADIQLGGPATFVGGQWYSKAAAAPRPTQAATSQRPPAASVLMGFLSLETSGIFDLRLSMLGAFLSGAWPKAQSAFMQRPGRAPWLPVAER
jgi:hypothetical protein